MFFLVLHNTRAVRSDTVICHHISGGCCPAKHCMYFICLIIVISLKVCSYLANTEECWTAVQENHRPSAEIFSQNSVKMQPLTTVFLDTTKFSVYKMTEYESIKEGGKKQHVTGWREWHKPKHVCQQNLHKLAWAPIFTCELFFRYTLFAPEANVPIHLVFHVVSDQFRSWWQIKENTLRFWEKQTGSGTVLKWKMDDSDELPADWYLCPSLLQFVFQVILLPPPSFSALYPVVTFPVFPLNSGKH